MGIFPPLLRSLCLRTRRKLICRNAKALSWISFRDNRFGGNFYGRRAGVQIGNRAANVLISTRVSTSDICISPNSQLSSHCTGSSAHTHFSVHSPKEETKSIGSLSALESSFLAGVLVHLLASRCIIRLGPLFAGE
ncbi:hypothetical protein M378DRAFT_357744 [Amanita muscaria Koide BX008]|uniref:Uncharacterized protein n=1 Tax=Amanita muscaria (strain Koide BX008) TaxID=946122 RepID=A0A0C2W9L3_AMAMK|nr:hypothetical protein M378DRAFT_357744 [Amanita muscaria Koide BX008]